MNAFSNKTQKVIIMEVLFCVLLTCFRIVNGIILSDDEYRRLPPIYDMDGYSKCKLDNDIFCTVKFKLKSTVVNNSVWQLIEVAKTDPSCYSHDIIYRGRCISSSLQGRNEEIYRSVTNFENLKLQNASLKAYVDNISCLEHVIRLSNYDYILVSLIIGYLLVVGYATMCDASRRKNNKFIELSEEGNKYMQSLSVLHNWEKLRRPMNKFDYNKLKCFQGIKTYNMVLVVTGHTILNAVMAFVNNTKYIEDFYANPIRRGFVNLCLHVVQTYFMISAWLFTIQLYEAVNKNKKLTFRDVIKGIIFRYLRLIPTLLAVISVHKSSWILKIFDGPQTDMLNLDYNGCRKNSWLTLLFLNNFLYPKDMCNFGTWYLSNDYQMFVISLLIFYVMVRWKLDAKIFGVVFIVTWLITAFVIYHYNLEVIFKATPENTKMENALSSYTLFALYTSLYSNFGSYIIGIIFGTIYYKYRNVEIDVNMVVKTFWIIGFFGLPLLAVTLSLYEYSPIMTAIIGASLKPIYTLGIAIGVFGMTFNIGGIVKRICEWSLVEFIGKWTYCTYLFHFAITFTTYVFSETLLEISDYVLIKNTVFNVVLSVAGGFLMHLFLELPLANIINHIAQPDNKLSKIKTPTHWSFVTYKRSKVADSVISLHIAPT